MRLLILNQYFWSDMAASAQLLSDLAEDAVTKGWHVTALAGRGTYAPSRLGRPPARETWRGVRIRRVPCTDFGRSNTIGRLADYLSFLLSAGVSLLFGRRHDIVLCVSPPPLIAVLGLVARLRGMRFVCKVEDIYPDVAVRLGVLHEKSVITRFFDWLFRRILHAADAVVALDKDMAGELQARGARRLEVIPNWSDGSAIRPERSAGSAYRQTLGLEGAFVVLYSGNLGRAHRFDAVAEAIRQLAHVEPDVTFLFVGRGARLPDLRASTRGLTNVRFLPYQPRERLQELYNASDLQLVTLQDAVSGLLVPSKYVASLASGTPVLMVGGNGSSIRGEIRNRAVGWTCPHLARSVVAATLSAKRDPVSLREMGQRARALFEERYDRRIATSSWLELLGSVAVEDVVAPEPDSAWAGRERVGYSVPAEARLTDEPW